jgi:hypothetical protein
MNKIEARKTGWQTTTALVNDLIASALDSSITLDERPSRPQAGSPTEGVSPSKAVNKRNKEKEIPGNLIGHEDLIRAYWIAKPKTKTDAAWKLLMTELTKIQDGYGDAALRTQLELAEANRWQGVTLANYERFGLPKGDAPAQSGSVDWAEVDRLTQAGAFRFGDTWRAEG